MSKQLGQKCWAKKKEEKPEEKLEQTLQPNSGGHRMTLKGFAWANLEYARRYGNAEFRSCCEGSHSPVAGYPGPIPTIRAHIICCPRVRFYQPRVGHKGS